MDLVRRRDVGKERIYVGDPWCDSPALTEAGKESKQKFGFLVFP